MNDVATELLSLIELADLSRQNIPIETRHVFETRNGSGTITINIADHECLVVTRITADNVDWTLAATLTVAQRGHTLPPLTTPLEVINDEPLLLVFEQGQLVFTFAVVDVLGTTARIKIQAARLPRDAGKRLRQLGTKLA